MGIISTVGSAIYTYKFLRLLTTPWNKTEAFKLGIVNEKGVLLKKAADRKTSEEKEAYSMFNRLVFNIKRLMNKVPGGSSRLGSFIAAYYLIKEQYGIQDVALKEIDYSNMLSESVDSRFLFENQFQPGSYYIKNPLLSIQTGEYVAHPGQIIIVNESAYLDTIHNISVFKGLHSTTKQSVLFTANDIGEIAQ